MLIARMNPSLNGNRMLIALNTLNKTKTKSIRREEIYSDTEIQKRVQIQI